MPWDAPAPHDSLNGQACKLENNRENYSDWHLSCWDRDYNLDLVRNNQVHMMMTADAATINSAQINVT